MKWPRKYDLCRVVGSKNYSFVMFSLGLNDTTSSTATVTSNSQAGTATTPQTTLEQLEPFLKIINLKHLEEGLLHSGLSVDVVEQWMDGTLQVWNNTIRNVFRLFGVVHNVCPSNIFFGDRHMDGRTNHSNCFWSGGVVQEGEEKSFNLRKIWFRG